MKRRDFFRKSFYMGAGTAIGSLMSADLLWKPQRLLAVPPADLDIVRTRCGSVQTWDFNATVDNQYHDYIHLPVVEDMLDEAVCKLTSQHNVVNAWNDIMNYQQGESVAIKINLNWPDGQSENWQNRPNQSTQMMIAVIRSLELINVPHDRIKIYDVSRDQVARIRTGLDSYGYIGIEYVARDRSGSSWDDNATMTFDREGVTRRYPIVLTSADHLINIALLKGHKSFITGALKNHYGTIEGNDPTSMSRSSLHDFKQVNVPLICTSTHIKDKLRLNVIEGFFMTYDSEYDIYEPCENMDFFPTGISSYPSSNCLMVSKNPVVSDSLIHDFVAQERSERSLPPFQYDFLVNAQDYGLGTYELGTVQNGDMAYSKINYQRYDMELMTRLEVDKALRSFKEGSVDQIQVTTKVKRLENNL